MMTTEPRTIEAPSAWLALTEVPRAMADLGALAWAAPLLASAPRGDGHAVLVIPGFTADDASTTLLRRYLDQQGYRTHSWDLGRNLGPKTAGRDGSKLIAALEAIYVERGEPVSIIGWSLGGVMARQLAKSAPQMVRQVITLGSPFTGNPRASSVWRAYELVSGQKLDEASTERQLCDSMQAPPVPSTAIYTRQDGIVAWQNCVEPSGPTTENIEVHGSHCGLGANPAVFYALADRLAQSATGWRPFERSGFKAWIYPRIDRDAAN